MPPTVAINARALFALSRRTNHSLPLSKLSLLQRMASNDNDKRNMEDAESSTARKRLWHTDDDGDDIDSSDLSEEEPLEEEPEEEEEEAEEEMMVEEETEEEVCSEEMPMNQFNTSEVKLYARRAHGIIFSNGDNTPSTSSEPPPTPESHRCSDEESRENDDFWM
jgi:hypothetical protein